MTATLDFCDGNVDERSDGLTVICQLHAVCQEGAQPQLLPLYSRSPAFCLPVDLPTSVASQDYDIKSRWKEGKVQVEGYRTGQVSCIPDEGQAVLPGRLKEQAKEKQNKP